MVKFGARHPAVAIANPPNEATRARRRELAEKRQFGLALAA
jgi:hypothetical protein